MTLTKSTSTPPRADKVGDNFAGLIDVSDEALGALIQTIKAEICPENQRKLITFNFSIISEDEHRDSKEETLLNHATSVNSRNSSSETLRNSHLTSSPLARSIRGCERRLHSAQATHNALAPNSSAFTNEGVISRSPDAGRSLSTPAVATTPWIKQEPTIAEPAIPATSHLPNTHRVQPQPRQQQTVTQSLADKSKRSCSAATTTADQSLNGVLPTLIVPNSSHGLLCQLLQKQWPPFNRRLGPDFSTLGCLVIVYRNVIRSLFNHNEPSRSFKEINELGNAFKGQKRKLWDYLWLDMTFPPEDPVHSAFHKKTTEFIHKLKASMDQEQEDGDATAAAKFTFKEIIRSPLSLNKLWDTAGLRLFGVGFFRECSNGQWRRAPIHDFGFPSLIEYTSTKLAATVDPESSLEAVINKLFHPQTGQGVFAPRGFNQHNIRLTCTFPAVIRIHYTSEEAMPEPPPPTAGDEAESNARNPAYDWLRDGPGKALRGFSILQERWNAKVADLPRRQQAYRLMAVVRMRRSPEESDLVRVYSDVGECILPMTTDLVYCSGNWSLAEANREFMLYYVPCPYNPRCPPAGMDSFPEGYEDAK